MARSASTAAHWRAALACVAVALLLLSAAPRAAAQGVDDPLEPLNRAVFQFNLIVDGTILKPVTQLYGFAVPDPAKRGVTNFLANLRAPIVFANQLLQGEREQAGITLGRFMVNTTFGLLGLVAHQGAGDRQLLPSPEHSGRGGRLRSRASVGAAAELEDVHRLAVGAHVQGFSLDAGGQGQGGGGNKESSAIGHAAGSRSGRPCYRGGVAGKTHLSVRSAGRGRIVPV